jgi:hypothetical protein
MTDKKEQARKLREAADVLRCAPAIRGLYATERLLRDKADELDPPAKERWERVREVHVKEERYGLRQKTQREIWTAVLAEADKGMVSKEELRRLAPWFSGGSGPDFSPSSYDQGVANFLRVINSL